MHVRPSVLVLDDGELNSVGEILARQGYDWERLQGEEIGASVRVPRNLLITSSERALKRPSFEHPGGGPLPVWLVVYDGDVPSLRRRLRALGVHYLAHAGVDEYAMALLLRQLLYRGEERRRDRRVPVDCAIRVVVEGHASSNAQLVELTHDSCRLIYDGTPALGSALRLALPASLCGAGMVLSATVIRTSSGAEQGTPTGTSVVARLDELEEADRHRLDELISGKSPGASVEPLASAPARNPSATRVYDDGSSIPNWEEMAQDAERRRHPRSAYGARVDSVGPSSNGAANESLGHDLSPQGLRIVGHPEIAAGTRVTLALHGGRRDEEVIVDAEVRRSDENGVALEFVGLTPGLRERIARLGDGLAAIEWLSEEGAQRIVVSRVLETHPDRER